MDPQRRIDELETALAEKDARIAEQDAQIAQQAAQIATLNARVEVLLKQVAELTERLNRNSRNSHLPPSGDGPGQRGGGAGRSKKGKSKRKRGGQHGHKGHHRALLPADQVDLVVNLFPPECESCWEKLPEVPDSDATRYQSTEIPPVRPHTTEYRRHAVTCPSCRYRTQAAYDATKIPASPFGPRLMAFSALLTGVYHVSRRMTVDLLQDMFGVRISLGGLSTVEARVSDAVEPAVNEAWQIVEQEQVKHTDGTSWLQAGATLSLWTIATAAATVFKIVTDGSKKTLLPLYGKLRGILVSDRAKALNFWAMERRQICWAHLLRKAISFSERDGPAGKIGTELLQYITLLFEYWHDHKEGTLSRERLQAWMVPVRAQVEALLRRAVAAKIERVSGSCDDILQHKEALWTFVDCDGVEPTNNEAERELRRFVLWRKRSFGTQSTRGNLFAERVMTVAHTARKQNRNVLGFLTACCVASRDHKPIPSLFSADGSPT